MADPQDRTENMMASEPAADEVLPGTEEQSASFLANLRSSYTPRPTGMGYYGSGGQRNRNNFLTSAPRFGLSASFAFDETTATTLDGEKIEKDIETETSEETDREQTRIQQLQTGDTLKQLPDQEILEFKNKDRLIIYKSLGWIMEDGQGNAITRQITPSLENPGDNSTFGLDRGGEIVAQAIEFSGITTIVFNNGDKIIFDLSGVSAVSRGNDAVYLREAIRKTATFGLPFRRKAI